MTIEFDTNFKPDSEGLPPALTETKDKLFYERRQLGLNIQFIRSDGDLDEMSFANTDSRDAHIAKFKRLGVDYVVSK